MYSMRNQNEQLNAALISDEKDMCKKWHKAAAKAKSIKEFEQAVGLVQV